MRLEQPLHVNQLGSVGLIKDLPSTELPPNAWTVANNVYFTGTSVQRSGGFIGFHNLPTHVGAETTSHLIRHIDRDEAAVMYTISTEGRYIETDGSTIVYRTPVGWVAATQSGPETSTSLALCAYSANQYRPVAGIAPGDTNFSYIMDGSDWEDTHWRVVRSLGNRIIVFNGAQAGLSAPQRFMWSDPASSEELATGWDTGSLDTTSGWAEVMNFEGPIIDAMALGDAMFVFGTYGVSRIVPSPDNYIFRNQPVFTDDGILNTGCVVPLARKGLFVVGINTIYLFDGHHKVDLAVDKVERWFRRTIDSSKLHRTFCYHDPRRREVWINFCSTSNDIAFPGTEYPNMALVYNYTNDSWSTRDLPNITSMAEFIHLKDAATWRDLEDSEETWDTIGGSWALAQGAADRFPLVASAKETTGQMRWDTDVLMAHDLQRAYIVGSPDESRNAPTSVLQRAGFDMSQAGVPLAAAKLIDMISVVNDGPAGDELKVTLGASDVVSQLYRTSSDQTWLNGTTRWLNTRHIGRFLGWTFTAEAGHAMNLTSFDLHVKPIAARG